MEEGTQGTSQGVKQLDLEIAERVKQVSAEDLIEILSGRALFTNGCTRKRQPDQ